jgi:hypothetical protein
MLYVTHQIRGGRGEIRAGGADDRKKESACGYGMHGGGVRRNQSSAWEEEGVRPTPHSRIAEQMCGGGDRED